MIVFLTSNPFLDEVPEDCELPCILNEANGFVSELQKAWREPSQLLVIASDPEDFEMNDSLVGTYYDAFSYHGLTIEDITVLDARNEDEAPELVYQSDCIVLCGGHVPTENAFFQEIGLRELLAGFDGIIIGISAGSMNCADQVYAQPEQEGESEDPEFARFIEGLGLTDVQILPHYQDVRDRILDGRRLYEDITAEDSMDHVFIAMVDGSYIELAEGEAVLHGEAYAVFDGQIEQISEEGDDILLE